MRRIISNDVISIRTKTFWTANSGRPRKQAKVDDELKDEILRSIALKGVASEDAIPEFISMVAKDKSQILDLHKGMPRIRYRLVPKFQLILGQPLALRVLNPFEIRCVLCGRVISYPCWYWTQGFAVNHFHYFVCFDSHSPDKVTARCYRG